MLTRCLLRAGALAAAAGQLQGTFNCVAFDSRGSALALGSEDGSLQLLEWPSLKQRFCNRCCPPHQLLQLAAGGTCTGQLSATAL